MNMANVLHRKQSVDVADVPASSPDLVPPSLLRPSPSVRPPSWPSGARALIALLSLAAVVATIGMAIGLASGDDGSAERQLAERIESLTVERDDALTAFAELDAELATLRAELVDTQNGSTELLDRVADLEGRIESLSDQRADALAAVEDLTAERDRVLGEADDRVAELANVRQRLAAAVAERDSLAELFPAKIDASLDDVKLAGKHSVKLSSVYCSGLATCGRTPALENITISKTPEGFLRLSIPRFVDGGLFEAGGALHLVADSTTAVPSCDGVTRTASIVATIYAGGYELASSGAGRVDGLHAVMTVKAPATAGCPAALAFYSVELTPTT